nr:beta-1,4-glucuronyltransferase 1-like isoform X3 [Procambarus clarkii]
MCARYSVLWFRRKVTHLSVIVNVALFLYLVTTLTSHKVYKCHTLVPKINVSEESPQRRPDTATTLTLQEKMYGDAGECVSGGLKPSVYQRGEYWVLENYIPALRTFPCNQSITYTTHADYTFLHNLEPLTSRWQGPVSVAVYAPGPDFNITIKTIIYLRDCVSQNIKNQVTFHIIFNDLHTPMVPPTEELLARESDCEQQQLANLTSRASYRHQQGLLYPINVARNTARQAARTYFVLPSDIELYPSINFIPEFFKLLSEQDVTSYSKARVYILPSFEIKSHIPPPATRASLAQLVAAGAAAPLFTTSCRSVVNTDWLQDWLSHSEESGLSVFHVEPSGPLYYRWEPVYVGTNDLPLYDERLYREGKRDKISQDTDAGVRAQMYALCARDYDLHILNNAFMVGSADILKTEVFRSDVKQLSLTVEEVIPELTILFGLSHKCATLLG